MKLLFAFFFGAGLSGWLYPRIEQRLGYGNAKSLWTFIGVVFVLSTVVFYSVLVLFVPK